MPTKLTEGSLAKVIKDVADAYQSFDGSGFGFKLPQETLGEVLEVSEDGK